MTPRIYSGADARALRERLADDTTSHTRTVTLTSAECAALDAVPHLAASVEHHEARAERAEAALLSLARGVWSAIGRSGDVTAGRDPAQFAAIVATDARLAVDDLACARDNAAARAERAEAERDAETLRADAAEATAGEWEDRFDAAVERVDDRNHELTALRAAVREYLAVNDVLMVEANRPRERPELLDAGHEVREARLAMLRGMAKRRDASLAALRALVPAEAPDAR